jgi:hypothetical protein
VVEEVELQVVVLNQVRMEDQVEVLEMLLVPQEEQEILHQLVHHKEIQVEVILLMTQALVVEEEVQEQQVNKEMEIQIQRLEEMVEQDQQIQYQIHL